MPESQNNNIIRTCTARSALNMDAALMMKHCVVIVLCVFVAASCVEPSRPDFTTPLPGTYFSLDSALNNVDDVRRLYLIDQGYDSIPFAITKFQHLEVLELVDNRISDIPLFLNKTILRDIGLDGNRLDSINTKAFPNTWQLRVYLSRNRIKYLPLDYSNMTQIVYLGVSHNRIDTIPRTIRALSNSLDDLSIDGNPLPKSEIDTLKVLLPNTKIYY